MKKNQRIILTLLGSIMLISIFFISCATQKGKTVLEVLDSGRYTYASIQDGDKKYWVAGPKKKLNVGQAIDFENSLSMEKFHSKALKRDFSPIIFANRWIQPNQKDESKSQNGSDEIKKISSSQMVERSAIKPWKNDISVEDILKGKSNYSGKKISVTGKVIKVNENILNRNWIHVQDGTSNNGIYDLTVTSEDKAKAGEIVRIIGTAVYDKDFGAGYVYSTLIENASIEKVK